MLPRLLGKWDFSGSQEKLLVSVFTTAAVVLQLKSCFQLGQETTENHF